VPEPFPDWTESEISYLAADAADRRTALEAAAVFLSSQRDHPQGPFGRARCAGVRDWLKAADEAYGWLHHRHSLQAVAIGLVAAKPDKEGTRMTTSLNLQDDQEDVFALSGVDDKGVQVGAPTDTWSWTSDDTAGAIITLAVSSDTTTCTVSAVAPGTATVSVSGANTGLQGAEAVIVTAGPAVTIDIVPGAPSQESAV
jgi:hypothetical protein